MEDTSEAVIVNDDWGRGLREWIIFTVGIIGAVALIANFLITGHPADVGLIGLVGVFCGYGSVILQKNGKS